MSQEDKIKELNEGWAAAYQNLKKDFDIKCAEIAALRAENAKFREVLTTLYLNRPKTLRVADLQDFGTWFKQAWEDDIAEIIKTNHDNL